MFNIIIPCYNSDYIEKCIESLESQTFKDFTITCINDHSTDNTFEKVKELAKKYNNIQLIEPKEKVWNGGARNIGIKKSISKYILFLDNDDWFNDENCLQSIYDTIRENNEPDLIRLSYYCLLGEDKQTVILNEDNPKDLVNSLYIAPWTKCVKTEKVALFPENTLIEDVVQHIAQIDNIESVAVCSHPIVVWNRNNVNAASLKSNQHNWNNKRISSIYRNIADLMDLQCNHNYCEEHRQWRIECYKNLVKDGKEETF
jgi:glycosyltransferase involved in cell wall biosynthesis